MATHQTRIPSCPALFALAAPYLHADSRARTHALIHAPVLTRVPQHAPRTRSAGNVLWRDDHLVVAQGFGLDGFPDQGISLAGCGSVEYLRRHLHCGNYPGLDPSTTNLREGGRLLLRWPGYDDLYFERPFKFQAPDGRVVTRAELVYRLGQIVQKFWEKAASARPRPGPWSLTAGHIRFENVFLTGLVNHYGDAFTVELAAGNL